jgi:hypothetical protein
MVGTGKNSQQQSFRFDDVLALIRGAKIPFCKGHFAAGFPVGEVLMIGVLSLGTLDRAVRHVVSSWHRA